MNDNDTVQTLDTENKETGKFHCSCMDRRAGKKIKNDAATLEKIKEWGRMGYKQNAVAAFLCVNIKTWMRSRDESPELIEAYLDGYREHMTKALTRLNKKADAGSIAAIRMQVERLDRFVNPYKKTEEDNDEEEGQE